MKSVRFEKIARVLKLFLILVTFGWKFLPAENVALVSGLYSGTLGAGAGTGLERMGIGNSPAAMTGKDITESANSNSGTTIRSISGANSAANFRLPVDLHWGLHFDFYRPYGLDVLQVSELGGFIDKGRWGLSINARQTDVEGLYQEQIFSINPVLHFLNQCQGGFAVTGLKIAGQGIDPFMSWHQDWGLIWAILPKLKLGGMVQGLPLWNLASVDADQIIWQFGLEASSIRKYFSQSLHLDFRKNGAGKWQTLTSLSFKPFPGFGLSTGLALTPMQLSLGFDYQWGNWRTTQSLRYHQTLGRTFLSGLSLTKHPIIPENEGTE